MKNVKKTRTLLRVQVLALALLLTPLIVLGQESALNLKIQGSFTGKYEGIAKDPNGEVPLKLELMVEAGKFSGRITTPREVHQIVRGAITDGTLSLELENKGSPARLTLKQKDDKLVGELTADGRKGVVEFHRVAIDEISGDWDAAADAQGQPFPFTLSLKLDGEMVTGISSSQLGNSTISSGIWKDGKLAIMLDSPSGQVALVGTLQDGKLVGDYDYSGLLQGKWVGVKKQP